MVLLTLTPLIYSTAKLFTPFLLISLFIIWRKEVLRINKKYFLFGKREPKKVLKELLPLNILADYDKHWFDILQMKRINRYKLSKWLVWFIERIIFKMEKHNLIGPK